MKNPLVSVIVPCYNQADYLREALDCVLAQTYTNWECVIVDDGSNDNSCAVAQEYLNKDTRFAYLYQENQGPSVARNNGIQHSSGEYILPLDADDLIADTYIEKAICAFVDNPEYKLVYSRAKKFGALNVEWNLPDYSYNKLLWDNIIFCSAIYKRKDYNSTKGYNPNMREGLEDWDFWLSLLGPDDKVYRINDILFYYRIKNASRNVLVTQAREALIQIIYENHKEKYEPFYPGLIHWKRQLDCLQGTCETLQKQKLEILNSKEYRLGDMLLKPLLVPLRIIRAKMGRDV